ncbi:MAG: hypothetical protein AAF447_20210 [Myxococcota bacterium]
MEIILPLRFVKLLAVLMLVAGTVGATLPGEMPLAARRRFAFAFAGPGFGLTWITGIVLAWQLGHALLSTWVVTSLALSLLSLQGVLYVAGKDGRAGLRPALLAWLPLVATLALMVWRPA